MSKTKNSLERGFICAISSKSVADDKDDDDTLIIKHISEP